ncbi:MAG TPA: hypothetical protein VJ691_18105 [Vicinamibacterales bacterium]|nr:hypothetical protein [Vicinamibacterales bacterium]
MTRGASLLPLLVKELRALLPLWAGTLAALAVAFAWRYRSISDLGVIGYVGGVAALGAHAIGHEYGYRTLPILLAQPAPRLRLFAAKYMVLTGMLVTIAAVAAFVFTTDAFRGNDAPITIILPLLAALFTTPLFTMMCRSTLAGVVLGVSGPMTIWVLTMVIAWWGFGIDGDTVTTWFRQRWVLLAAIACPVFATLTWRAFTRMEAIDGLPATLTLPRWLSARPGMRRRAPWRALIAKEIHLQQMTIVITLFYGVIWLMGVGLRDTVPASVVLPLEAVLLLYCLGLALVIGAVASAEERQQGTLEAQLLQPVGALAQWMIKCIVVLSLAILLGVVLPAVLIAGFSREPSLGLSKYLVLLVILLTSSALYISSLVGSGVKAMTWSLPVAIGVAMFIQTTRTAIASASMRLGQPLPTDHTEATTVAIVLLPLLVMPPLLWFGFVNHTSAEHPLGRTAAQVGVLTVLVVAVIVAAGALV